MDKQKAKKILLDLHNFLDQNGIEHFLGFGTYLGAFRDNDFLSEDIDVCCHLKDYWKVREAIDDSNEWEYNCVWDKEIALWKYDRKIDILFYDEYGNSFIYKRNPVFGKWNIEQRYNWNPSDIFPLKELSFLDQTFKVPNKADEYFTKYYGEDWKTPNPKWNRDDFPCPNLDKEYKQFAITTYCDKEVTQYIKDTYPEEWYDFVEEGIYIGYSNVIYFIDIPEKKYNLDDLIQAKITNKKFDLIKTNFDNNINSGLKTISNRSHKGIKFKLVEKLYKYDILLHTDRPNYGSIVELEY